MSSSSTVDGKTRETEPSSSLDVLFDALAHRRRRYAVEHLSAVGTSVAVADLAREIAARERGAPASDVSAEDAKQVHASLLHVHVPKLAGADVVDYDRQRGTVALPADSERVEALVERATEAESTLVES